MRNSVWILAKPEEIKTIARTLFFLIPELKFNSSLRITAYNNITNKDLNNNKEIFRCLPNVFTKSSRHNKIISIFIDENLSLAFSIKTKDGIKNYIKYRNDKIKFFDFTLNNRKEELIKLINWISNEDC